MSDALETTMSAEDWRSFDCDKPPEGYDVLVAVKIGTEHWRYGVAQLQDGRWLTMAVPGCVLHGIPPAWSHWTPISLPEHGGERLRTVAVHRFN
jgi:hypothetical protein